MKVVATDLTAKDTGVDAIPQAASSKFESVMCADSLLQAAPSGFHTVMWSDFFLTALLRLLLPLFSWMFGRQTTARLLCTSRAFSEITPMYEQVTILHSITRRQPLGTRQCIINQSAWLLMNILVSTDRQPTNDDTFVIICPLCQSTFHNFLWAVVRYQFRGKLCGATQLLSELDAAETDSE